MDLVASIYINEAFLILTYVVFADPDPDEMVLGMDSDLALAPETLEPLISTVFVTSL